MSGIGKAVFGDDSAKKAQAAQQRAAEVQRQIAAVSNDRQLAVVNEQEQKASPSRRAPRGRRLFSTADDGAATTLA